MIKQTSWHANLASRVNIPTKLRNLAVKIAERETIAQAKAKKWQLNAQSGLTATKQQQTLAKYALVGNTR
jgi:hypothetical protein